MSGALSSLFSGSITPPQPTGSDTSTTSPLWLQDYLYNLDQAAANLTAQPYTPFPGPSIAAPSSDTEQAWRQATANQGNWQPQLTQAQGATNGALNLSAQGAGLIQSASPYMQSAASDIQSAFPYIQAGAGLTNQGADLTGRGVGLTNQGVGLTNQGVGLTYQGAGLTNRAVDMTAAASQPIGADQINRYMSPYTSGVVGALQQAANTNLRQNQLPLISSQFVSAGQAASPQMAQADNNALYQSNQALDQAVAGALQSGYQNATNTALTEQGAQMQGAAQLGAYGGQLGQYGGQLGAYGGQMGAYGGQMGALGGQLGAFGGEMAGYGGAIGQLGSQTGQLGTQIGQLGGALNSAAAEQGALGAQTGQLGALQQQLGASDTGLLAASGASQDTTNQNNINAALNNFYAQQQWPYQNLSYASNIVRGQPITSNTQQVGLTYPPTSSYTTSPISAFLGGTLAASSISNGLGGANLRSLGLAKGGRVRRGALSYAKAA